MYEPVVKGPLLTFLGTEVDQGRRDQTQQIFQFGKMQFEDAPFLLGASLM